MESLLDFGASDSVVPPPVSSALHMTTFSHLMITRGNNDTFRPWLYHVMTILSSSKPFQAFFSLKKPRGFKSIEKHPKWFLAMND
jgi:hypothetical protein